MLKPVKRAQCALFFCERVDTFRGLLYIYCAFYTFFAHMNSEMRLTIDFYAK